MVKLKTNQQFRYGKKNIIPYAQEVEIDENGYIEVSDDIAEKIVESNCGFEFADEQSTNGLNQPLGLKADINDELDKSNDDLKLHQDDNDDNDDDGITAEQAKQALSIKTLQELKDMCKQSNFPSNEWRNLNKEEVVEYLSAKLAQ